jgi:hypothetical protein
MIDFFGPNRAHVPLLFLALRSRHRIVYGFLGRTYSEIGIPGVLVPSTTVSAMFFVFGCCRHATSAFRFTTFSFCAHHLHIKICLEAPCTG